MRSNWQTKATVGSALLLAVVVSVASAGAPDGDPATSTVPMVIPYEGYLTLDGAPVNLENEPVQFYLCGQPDEDVAQCWSQQQNVSFHNGRFSVLLGAGGNAAQLSGAILDADDLYVRIGIHGTLLAGAQRIVPVPYAQWSGNAADLNVAHDAHVANNADVGRNLQVAGDTSVTHNLTVGGAVTLGAAGLHFPPPDGLHPAQDVHGLWLTGVPGNNPLSFRADFGAVTLMVPLSQGICWLAYETYEQNLNGGGSCGVFADEGQTWILRADGDAHCAAYCMQWQ